MELSFAWHRLSPSFRTALCDRVARDRAYLLLGDELLLVTGLDGGQLLADGCAGAYLWQRGQLVAVVEAEALIAMERREATLRCLDAIASRPGEQTQALRLLCGGAEATVAFLLYAAYGPGAGARGRLQGAKDGVPALCRAARAWQHLFQDGAAAADALVRAEAESKSDEDWLRCAAARAAIGDDAGVERCLMAAALGAPIPVLAARLALLGDAEGARRGLLECAGEGADSQALRACAAGFRGLFGDEEEAARCLTLAEARARSAADFIACAALRVEVFGEDPDRAARLCLASAEAQAKGTADWLILAGAWQDTIKDSAQVERSLRAAEAAAAGGLDWLALALAWQLLRGDEGAARRCLLAELSLRAGADCLVLARGWREIFAEEAEARQRLRDFEPRLGSAPDWESAARAYREVFADEAEAARCQEEAKRLLALESAIEQGDWLACATGLVRLVPDATQAQTRFRALEARAKDLPGQLRFVDAWVQAFSAPNEARRCLLGANATTTAERLSIAGAWKRLLADEAEGRRLLLFAEAGATSGAEWLAIAAAWEEIFADSASARRARLHELTLRAGGDIVLLATGWRAILGDAEEARGRLREAEAGQEGQVDIGAWQALAMAWRQAFSDEGEAARCDERAALLQQLKDALSTSDLVRCAQIWRQIAPAEAAQRLRAQAQEAKGLLGRLALSSAWQVLGAEAEVRAALAEAEAMAASLAEQAQVGAAYHGLLGDDDAGRRCLLTAEALVVEGSDWLALAQAFADGLGDAKEAERCRLRELDLRAGDDLLVRARGWRDIFADEGEARRRVRELELRALGASDWQRIKQIWAQVFADEAEADRCQGEADRLQKLDEALAAGAWVACARIWKEILPDEAEAQRRFRALEERARTLADWAAFAEGWKVVFEKDEDCRRCMKEAEGRVRFRSDWKACADAWRRMGDFAEAERCGR